jgi:hypothetical protein
LIHSTKKNQAYQEFPDCFRIATLAGFKSTWDKITAALRFFITITEAGSIAWNAD